ncbi:MAG: arylesterase [Burkholderiaceae bacterium]|nr:arylesterase [Burkholderiaceae bacterium]
MSNISRYRRGFTALVFLASLSPCAVLAVDAKSQAPAQAQTLAPVRILVVGDSLSAEYGITRDSGWVSLLRRTLSTANPPVEVINASISGDTTSGGLTRMASLLDRHAPSIVIIELGANDGLRGLPVAMARANLQKMMTLAKDRGARVILVGIQVPPNYGREYAEGFRKMFGELAVANQAALVPFLFSGLDDTAAYFQSDRMHPNEAAQPILLRNIMEVLDPEIKAAQRPVHPK